MGTISTTTVLNIAALKALTPPANGTVRYVEGYFYNPGTSVPMDNGGGFFRYDSSCTTPPDLGINFCPNSITPPAAGRWVRQYDGSLDVAYFGIVKIPQFDNLSDPIKNAARLQAMIDYCYLNSSTYPQKDFTIYFPEGIYWLYLTQRIEIKTGTHIKGDTNTLIRLGETNVDFLFDIAPGFVKRISLENLKFNLGGVLQTNPANATGWLLAEAINSGADNSGGLYGATIRDVYVENIGDNHGLYFKGGEQTDPDGFGYRRCNQFVYLDNVIIERFNGKNSFRMTGLNVNISFSNCNPMISTFSEVQPTMSGACWYIDSVLPHAPTNNESILFYGCDAGGAPGRPAEQGFYIRNSQNIFIENCWIEDAQWGIVIEDSQAVSILDNHFANAAAHGSIPDVPNDPGAVPNKHAACIKVTSTSGRSSFVTAERNHVGVTDINAVNVWNERFIMNSGDSVINSANNYFPAIIGQTEGITQATTISAIPSSYITVSPPSPTTISGIVTEGKKVVRVSIGSSGSNIYRIDSSLNTGELLQIFAENGSLTFHGMHVLGLGRNIGLSGNNTFSIAQGHGATFMKVDGIYSGGAETYMLQLISAF